MVGENERPESQPEHVAVKRDAGRERLSTYVERGGGAGEGVVGEERGTGVSVSVGFMMGAIWRRACQHAPSGLAGEASTHAR